MARGLEVQTARTGGSGGASGYGGSLKIDCTYSWDILKLGNIFPKELFYILSFFSS
jgi:hypothetical protein